MYVARQKMHIHNIPLTKLNNLTPVFRTPEKVGLHPPLMSFTTRSYCSLFTSTSLFQKKTPGTNTRGADGKDETMERSLGSIRFLRWKKETTLEEKVWDLIEEKEAVDEDRLCHCWQSVGEQGRRRRGVSKMTGRTACVRLKKTWIGQRPKQDDTHPGKVG